jgi:2-polyprenyl-3-methyl-5-hydroxy-6-metoxy-1,4-benzoquinol methylase
MLTDEVPQGRLILRSVSLHEIISAARLLFSGSSFASIVQRNRPFICPFGALIAEVPGGSNILDIGCGAGLYLGLLASFGRIREGIGFDASAPAIAAAQKMARKVAPLRLNFCERDVKEPWPDGTFDVVSLIDVMHHVPQPARETVLQRAADRVRPGGLFIYKDMADRPVWRATANRLHDLVMARQWVHYAPVEAVEAFCRSTGLELIHREDINMLWYGHEMRIFRRPAQG